MLDFLKSPSGDRTTSVIISIIIKTFPGLQVKPLQLMLKDKAEIITRICFFSRAPKLLLSSKKILINPLVGVVTGPCPLPTGYTVTVKSFQYSSQHCDISKSTPHDNDKELSLPWISPPVTRPFSTEETPVSMDRKCFWIYPNIFI